MFGFGVVSKAVLILSAALAGSVAVAIFFGRDLQRERARADALASRLTTLEPLERDDLASPHAADVKVRSETTGIGSPAIEPELQQTPLVDAPERAAPRKRYQGTVRAREQVERLQSALASGTPLQEYQIQPLINAIDRVRSEMERDRGQRDGTGDEVSNRAAQLEANSRTVSAASDILFESQLEKFMELLDAELEAETRDSGRK